ncbi:hypothetical protein RQP46_002904 [Phenoliferia psychrophenolica]
MRTSFLLSAVAVAAPTLVMGSVHKPNALSKVKFAIQLGRDYKVGYTGYLGPEQFCEEFNNDCIAYAETIGTQHITDCGPTEANATSVRAFCGGAQKDANGNYSPSDNVPIDYYTEAMINTVPGAYIISSPMSDAPFQAAVVLPPTVKHATITGVSHARQTDAQKAAAAKRSWGAGTDKRAAQMQAHAKKEAPHAYSSGKKDTKPIVIVAGKKPVGVKAPKKAPKKKEGGGSKHV